MSPWVQLITPLGRRSNTSFSPAAGADGTHSAIAKKIPVTQTPTFPIGFLSSAFVFLVEKPI
jgi:hypothetical protein